MLKLVAAMALMANMACHCNAQPVGRGADGAPVAADIVAGIVRYTRWPDSAAPIRICVSNEGDHAASAALTRRFADTALGSHPLSVAGRRLDAESAATLLDCQVVYVDAARPPALRALLTSFVNRPVLTIGHGEDFCSFGGMFCLESTEAGERIQANLDSISRSGLRINPQLLRLTQRDRSAR